MVPLLFFLIIGCGLALAGIFVMRNPILFGYLDPGAQGHYQRMVLDRLQRNQMRVVGLVGSNFGLVIFTAALKGMLKFDVLERISNGFLVLLWLSFVAAFGFGLIYLVVQVVRGRSIASFTRWFEMRRRQIALGPIAVYPTETPQMIKETEVFTVVYCVLVTSTVVVSLLVR
jgi:hypothetical protein